MWGSQGIEQHRNKVHSLKAGKVPLGCVCGDADGYFISQVELHSITGRFASEARNEKSITLSKAP